MRARLTLATTGVVALALVIGAFVLVTALRVTLLRQRDDAARDQARGIAALVTSGRLPDPVPTGGTTIVQVVDAAGRVRAASPGGDRLVPMLEPAELARARTGAAVELPGRRLGADDALRVIGVAAGGASDPQTVLVAGPVVDLERGLQVVTKAVAVVCGLLVLGVALLSRWLVGSALRPVEALTRGAAELGTTGAAGTLPLPAADDEVRRLAVTLNAMLARLDASARRQRAFAADAAHELRSPLASIRTAVEVSKLAPAGAGADGWAETVDGVLADTDRMTGLVDDLLLLARLDDGRAGPGAEPREGDAAAVADSVVERLGRRRTDGVRVGRTGAAHAEVRMAPDALERVLVNLVENAVRYARAEVWVGVEAAGTEVLLTVSDDGPGVPAADRERVFERFTRLDDARSRDEGGSGLGLAIVRELVRVHGGDVHLEDATPGLRAVVRLPAGARRG